MRVRWCHAETRIPREKVMVWLDALAPSKISTLLVILDEATADHSYYIKNVLPSTLKYGNEGFGVTSGSFNRMVMVQIDTEII